MIDALPLTAASMPFYSHAPSFPSCRRIESSANGRAPAIGDDFKLRDANNQVRCFNAHFTLPRVSTIPRVSTPPSNVKSALRTDVPSVEPIEYVAYGKEHLVYAESDLSKNKLCKIRLDFMKTTQIVPFKKKMTKRPKRLEKPPPRDKTRSRARRSTKNESFEEGTFIQVPIPRRNVRPRPVKVRPSRIVPTT